METLTVRNLSFRYPETEHNVLNNVSFSVKPGEFITVCGTSGCGKSTLLSHFKTVLTPFGERHGDILFNGKSLEEVSFREQSVKIGFVRQSPENQVVTDKVWHELAFGLESLGLDTPTIRRRVAEMASFFGIQNWFYKNVTELSGGQKQLLNLASIMAMQPELLILDEPTSQLDPVTAGDFLATVGRINRELGVTVIITEHRLEDVFPMSTRAIVMDEGRITADAPPEKAGEFLKGSGHRMFLAMPSAMRIWGAVDGEGDCPITAAQGRRWLEGFAAKNELAPLEPEEEKTFDGQPSIELDDVWFRYEKNLPDVLQGIKLKLYPGEIYAILGSNGAGKTTTLSVINGAVKAQKGQVTLKGKKLEEIKNPFDGLLGVLPQNPQALFASKTVYEDLMEIFSGTKLPKPEREKRAVRVIEVCRLEKLVHKHPYDLSGGEQQRAALAKVLLTEPEILLLDEPTKGLDAQFKQELASILRGLTEKGVCILMVSHDVEFCAKYADRCGMFFTGKIVYEDTPRRFFTDNTFYTTTAARMSGRVCPGAVTTEDVMRVCGKTPEKEHVYEYRIEEKKEEQSRETPVQTQRTPLWRKILAGCFGALLIITLLNSTGIINLPHLADGWEYTGYVELIIPVLGIMLTLGRRSAPADMALQTPVGKRSLSKRTAAAAAMILVAVPLTIFCGITYFGDRKYLAVSLLVLVECMLPFFMVFEGRKPHARELVIIAVLCAIGVAGRAALFMVPNCKPVMAVVIISGVAFGGETGFLVGAMTMLASNMMFSQGPWTPWQMFAMGIIGFLAGVLFRKGLLRRDRITLGIFGFIMAVIVYGGIMNPAAAIMAQKELNLKILGAYYLSGLPVDIMHGAATFIFLYFGAEPMLEKLDRIKTKYGLIS